MTMNVMAWMLGTILFLLGGLHIYWIVGGKFGALAAIPSNGSELLFKPKKAGTAFVAGALIFSGYIALALGEVVHTFILAEWMVSTGGWIIALVFFIRTIGDFHWVGFFKKKKGTLFAHWDTRLYSPLCLFIAILWVTLLMR